MAETRSTILKIELDVSALKKDADEAAAKLEVLRPQMERLRKETGTGTVEYAKIKEQVRQYTKQLNDNAAALAINERFTDGVKTSQNELRLLQKALTVQYNALTKEEREQTEEGKKLTKTLADVAEAISLAGEEVGDFRTRVGQYELAIKKAIGTTQELKKAQTQIGFAYGQNKEKLDALTESVKAYTSAGDTSSEAYMQAVADLNFYSEALVINQENLDAVTKELEEQQVALDNTIKEAAKIGFVYGNNENAAASLKSQIKALKDELATLDPGSDRFAEATAEAAELQDKLNDINETIRAQAAGSGFEKLSNTFDLLVEDAKNLDFEGVSEKLNTLANISSNLTFKEMLAGLKSVGTAIINLGRVILANPIFLLAAVIAAVGVAIYTLTGSTRDLEAENEALNDSYERQTFLLDLLEKQTKRRSDFVLRLAELEGKSAAAILKIKQQQVLDEEDANEQRIQALQSFITEQNKLANDANADGNTELAKSIREKVKTARQEFITRIDDRSRFSNEYILLEKEFYKKQQDEAKEAAKKAAEEEKRRAEQRAADAKEAAKRIRDLIIEGDQLTADAQRQILDAEVELRKQMAEINLDNEKDKAEELLRIETDRYNRLLEILDADVLARQAAAEARAVDEIEAAKGTAEQIAEQKRLIEENLDKELDAIDRSARDQAVQIANDLAIKEKEIKRLTNSELIKLNEERLTELEATLLEEENYLREQGDSEEEIARKTAQRRIEIARQQYKIINDDATKSDADKLKAAAELDAAILDIEAEGAEARKAIREKEAEQRKQLVEESVSAFQEAANSISQIQQQQIEGELNALQKKYDAANELLQKQLDSGLITQEKFDDEQKKLEEKQQAEEAKLKKEAFRKQKIADIIQAGISISNGVLQALGSAPPPINVILAGITAAAGAAELIKIKNAPEPAFAGGGRVLSGARIQAGDGKPIYRTNGDNLLASVKVGEVILNERQQAALGGDATFAALGVPGFAGGGVVANQITAPIDYQVSNAQILEAMSSFKFVVGVEDIVDGLNRKATVESSADVF